jgi:hypothetical protein
MAGKTCRKWAKVARASIKSRQRSWLEEAMCIAAEMNKHVSKAVSDTFA